MKKVAALNEPDILVNRFLQSNPQTSFLLNRMKSQHRGLYDQSIRTAYLSLLICQGLGLSSKEQEMVYRTALIMDIGKLSVPNNPGKLTYKTEEERSILMHPQYSWDLLQPLIVNQWIDGEAVLQHHENLDGTGYPYEKKWNEISLNARILRVADSFVLMTSVERRTFEVIGVDKALEELYRWSDLMFDADLVELLCHHYYPNARHKRKKIITVNRTSSGFPLNAL